MKAKLLCQVVLRLLGSTSMTTCPSKPSFCSPSIFDGSFFDKRKPTMQSVVSRFAIMTNKKRSTFLLTHQNNNIFRTINIKFMHDIIEILTNHPVEVGMYTSVIDMSLPMEIFKFNRILLMGHFYQSLWNYKEQVHQLYH